MVTVKCLKQFLVDCLVENIICDKIVFPETLKQQFLAWQIG